MKKKFIILVWAVLLGTSCKNDKPKESSPPVSETPPPKPEVGYIRFENKSESCQIFGIYMKMGMSRMDKNSGESYDLDGYPDKLLEPGDGFRGEFDPGVYKGVNYCCSCGSGNKQFKKRVKLKPFQVVVGETTTVELDCNKGGAEISDCD